MDETRREVPDGVATEDERVGTGGFADGPVEGEDDFGGGAEAVGEDDAVAVGRPVAELEAPATEDVEGGEIVLDEAEAPADGAADVAADQLQRLGA